MKAYYSTVEKSYRRSIVVGSKASNVQREESKKGLDTCPRCREKQAVVIHKDRLINQGQISIHARHIYCMKCKEVYAIPL